MSDWTATGKPERGKRFMRPPWPSGASGLLKIEGGVTVHLVRGRELTGAITSVDGWTGTPISVVLDGDIVIPWMQVDYFEPCQDPDHFYCPRCLMKTPESDRAPLGQLCVVCYEGT